MVTNWVPGGLTVVSVASSRGTCAVTDGVVTCDMGVIPWYSSATVTIEYTTTTPGYYTNNAVVVSDLTTNAAASLATLVTPARFFAVGRTHTGYYLPTATPIPTNRVLIVGAPLVKTADVYNVSTRLFEQPGLTQSLHGQHTATMMTNGLVLIVGGYYLPFIPEVFNPANNQFHAVGNTYAPRMNHRATLLSDGRVLLCGNAYPPLTNEVFNPITETFSLAPDLQCDPSGILLPNGKYLTVSFGSASLYDPTTGLTTPTGPPIRDRSYHAMTLLSNGKVLLTGGQIYKSGRQLEYCSASADLYDIASGTFSPTAPMTLARREHGASALPAGSALIVGGITNGAIAALDRAEVFDPDGTMDVPGIGISDTNVVETDAGGTNWMLFNVWLTTTSAWPVTVDFATSTGSAGTTDWGVANVDFVPTNGTLVIPPGQTNAVIPVAIRGDNVREPNETLTMNLGLPTQAWMVRSSATGTIIDNDPVPSVTIAPASVTERDTGLTNLVFSVTLSAQSLTNITVDYASNDGTAIAGSDYFAVNGTLLFNPGETNKTIFVPVIGDMDVEQDETLEVTLSNCVNAILATSEATGTIYNDDGLVGRTHHLDVSTIGSLQTQSMGFPVTITARDIFGNVVSDFSGLVQLSTLTTNSVATNLNFEQSTLAPWTTFNNTPYDKPFQPALFDVAGLGHQSTAFRTIAGGGSNGIVQNVYLTGGRTYTFRVNCAQNMQWYDNSCLGSGIYLQVGFTNASWGADICGPSTNRGTISLVYTPPTNGVYLLQFIIARDYYSGDALAVYLDDVQISYPVITPTLVTNAFTNGIWSGVVASLQAATNVTLLANDTDGHSGTSNPFDIQSMADLGLTVSSQIQGALPLRTGGKLQYNLAITNRGPAGVSNVVVHIQTVTNVTMLSTTNAQGTISNVLGGVDWLLPSMPKGSNFTATLVYRADLPGDFTNRFSITSDVVDANLADNFIAISNHIDPPLLVIADVSGNETAAAATGLVFVVTLSGPSAQTITVDYLTVDATAANGVDYYGTNGSITFVPGTTNGTVRVYAIDDILDEPDRFFNVLLTNVVGAIINDASGQGVILDDDPPPTISIADVTVVEGDSGTTNAVFKLTLSKPAIVNVTVNCSTAPNTASTNDYISTNATVTFPVGSTNLTFTVAVKGNTVNEPDETFFLNLASPGNATLARSQAVGTILNDDAIHGRLDHFVWDPIPSPRYRNWAFPVNLRAVDYLGDAVTNASIAATVTARTTNGYASWIQDNFEGGNSIGWTNFNSTFSTIVTNETAAEGIRSLRLTGSTSSTTAGLAALTPTNSCLADRMTFSVRVSRTNQVAGRFTVCTRGIYRLLAFYFNNNDQMGLIDSQGVMHGTPYQSNRWYQVDLYIDWTALKVACLVDGSVIATNIGFLSTSATNVDQVILANVDNTTSWWDNITVFNDNLAKTFNVTPSNFTAFANSAKSISIALSGLGAGTNTYLIADDGLEHVGSSGVFDLLPVNLTLSTPASITEGNGAVGAQVAIPAPFPQSVTVTVTSTMPARLTVPSTVVIPANETNASFNLTLLDDAVASWVQTAWVSVAGTNLDAATNNIILIDNDPTMAVAQYGRLSDGRFQLNLQGPPMQNFALFASSNLLDWTAVSNFNFTNTPLIIIDSAGSNFDRRFYRLSPSP